MMMLLSLILFASIFFSLVFIPVICCLMSGHLRLAALRYLRVRIRALPFQRHSRYSINRNMHLTTRNFRRAGSLRFVWLTAVVGFSVGCQRRVLEPAQELPGTRFLVHEISVHGENPGIIALWYTGDVKQWKNLYIPASAGTVYRLKAGDRILIPVELLKRSDALDAAFVRQHVKRSAPKSTVGPSSNPVPTAPREAQFDYELPGEESWNEQVSSADLEKEFLEKMVP